MSKISGSTPTTAPTSTGTAQPAKNTVAPEKPKDRPWQPLGAIVDATKHLADSIDLGIAKTFGKELSAVGLTVDTPPGKAPVLKRPVVMVPGFTMDASSYDPMAKHLASDKRNGPVAVYTAADGQFHSGSAKGPVMDAGAVKGAKIFELEYSNPMAPSTQKATEIASAMKAIHSATGSGTMDVVAHSAGCTDFRQYLQTRSPDDKSQIKIGEAVLVGPASHGTFMGNVGDVAGKPLGAQDGGKELELGSPLIKSLNDNWAQQRNQVQGQVTIVGVSGAPTPGPGGISNGDGFMPVNQLAMPDARTVVLRGFNPTPIAHLTEIGKGGVINAVDQALAGGPTEK